jgi:hypothetical protein
VVFPAPGGPLNVRPPVDLALRWKTFAGSTSTDQPPAVAVDASGNIYIVSSGYNWGTPIRPYTGNRDGFVVKFNPSGVLQWSTFLGGTGNDSTDKVTVDSSGNTYATGASTATWGSPLRPIAGFVDPFVAKLSEDPIWRHRHAVGDFDGDGADEAAVDFGAVGLWLWSSAGTWTQLSGVNGDYVFAEEFDKDGYDELMVNFGAIGLWLYDQGAWS